MKRALIASLAVLAACTTGQTNTTPSIPGGGGGGTGSYALQLSVGTVNFSTYAVGLNVLETFRDGNGFTAVPITSASLAGPAGFHGVRGSKDPGANGGSTIPLGSAGNSFLTGPASPGTEIAGVDGWGIGPPSCSCPGVNTYPLQPQFADNPAISAMYPGGGEPFYGGPPAYPPTSLEPSALSSLVSIPSSWPEGFYLVGVDSEPSGRYTISASYSQNGIAHATKASATLQASRVLPVIGVTGTGNLDGSADISVRLPRHVKQAIVNIIDGSVPPAPGATCVTGLGFASVLFTSSGTRHIPGNLGNYGAGGAPTFCRGDLLLAQAYGFDYDDFDLGPPGNTQQRPPLPAQADVTISLPSLVVMPGSPARTMRWPGFPGRIAPDTR